MNRLPFASGVLLPSAASRVACVLSVIALLWAAIHWAIVLP
ncbi:hypothetical protein [Rhizobium sullae]|uniref:Uncharacterized protein n=1 Tax=Rhizobium sullae TaxID=50338 RepID=A0ABY5XKY8_RHISU|nr:hypothetical protein [Rhizobium sullae]UWU14971.1 hypothetical protein N2599_02770 [Rhizobium sullae]